MRRSLLLIAALLLSTSSLVAQGAADQMVIQRAITDSGKGRISIFGANFGPSPQVTFGGTPLQILSATNTAIVAVLPAFDPGAYRLTVRGRRPVDVDSITIMIGATGPAAPHADPLPQALILTAIVIGFATTALLLVVLLAARGLTGTDHVDGRERER